MQHEAPPGEARSATAPGPLVIIVDDDAQVAAAFARVLRSRFELAVVGSAESALQRCAASSVAAVLSDYGMCQRV